MILLDARELTADFAHTYLREQLAFPDYYGENLDALYECLTELPETRICFTHTEEAPAYFERIYAVFQDAAGENPDLILE